MEQRRRAGMDHTCGSGFRRHKAWNQVLGDSTFVHRLVGLLLGVECEVQVGIFAEFTCVTRGRKKLVFLSSSQFFSVSTVLDIQYHF